MESKTKELLRGVGRVIYCCPLIQGQTFLGEEPTATPRGLGVFVRWSDDRFSRLSSHEPAPLPF